MFAERKRSWPLTELWRETSGFDRGVCQAMKRTLLDFECQDKFAREAHLRPRKEYKKQRLIAELEISARVVLFPGLQRTSEFQCHKGARAGVSDLFSEVAPQFDPACLYLFAYPASRAGV